MPKETKQHCPKCGRVFNNGLKEWETISNKKIIQLNAEVYAGKTEIMDETCIDCHEKGIAGLGLA